MIISNNIKIGLNILGLCDYYYKLKMYVEQFEQNNDSVDCILIRLNVFNQDNFIKEEYFYRRNNELFVVVHSTHTIDKYDHWFTEFKITNDKINTEFEHTLDLDYYYKNN